MIRRALPLLVAAALATPTLTGCTFISTTTEGAPAPTPTSTSASSSSSSSAPAKPGGKEGTGLGSPMPGGKAPSSTGKAPSPTGKAKSAGLGDPCELLNKAEVTQLTGRAITQIDPDGASPSDAVRYCQWQLSGGQLAIFISTTTLAEFETLAGGGTPVDGVGEQAFTHSGHLYVLADGVQLDIYARGGSDAQNLKVAKLTTSKILPRI